MSFDNHYPNRKDWRKPYYDWRQYSRQCRSNGIESLPNDSRILKEKKIKLSHAEQVKEYLSDASNPEVVSEISK